jgi:hypothetical protein
LLRVSSQISLDEKTISLNNPNDPIDLLVGQILGPKISRNFRFFNHLTGTGRTQTVNIPKTELSPFFSGNINS